MNSILGLFVLLLFLFSVPSFAAVVLKKRAEYFFLPTLIFNAYLLYIAAIFHWTFPGFKLIFLLNLCFCIPLGVVVQKIGFSEAKKRLVTPGISFAFCYVIFYFFITIWRDFASWDEISHWGAAAKLFLRDGKLGCEYGGILSHASYPPGATIISAMTHLCFGEPFREHLVQLGSEILLIAIWIFPMGKLKWEQRFHVTFCCLAYFGFIPIFLREDFHTCYTDAPLACLFALNVYIVLLLNRPSFGKLFCLALTTSFMFFERNAGFGYAIATMALLLCRMIFDRKKLFEQEIEERDKFSVPAMIVGFILVFTLPFLVKYSWSFLLQYYHTPLKFSGNSITAHGIWNAFFHNEPQGSVVIIRDFLLRLLNGYLEVFLLILYGLHLLKKKSCSAFRANQARYAIPFFSVAFIFFLFGMLIFYIFEFHELKKLPSYDRYVSAFILTPGFVTYLLWMDEKNERALALPAETGFGVNSKMRHKLLVAVSIWCLVATVYNMIPYAFFRWGRHRRELDKIHVYDSVLKRDGIKFSLICSTGVGFKNYYGAYLYPENFRELTRWDPVLVKKSDSSWNYTKETTPDELKAEIKEKKLNYVYIESIRPEFIRDFKSVFTVDTKVDESINNKLFQVTDNGMLQKMPTGEMKNE